MYTTGTGPIYLLMAFLTVRVAMSRDRDSEPWYNGKGLWCTHGQKRSNLDQSVVWARNAHFGRTVTEPSAYDSLFSRLGFPMEFSNRALCCGGRARAGGLW
jgi:hypothetical protein